MIIEAEHVGVRFGRRAAVSELTLAVPEGAALALIGANGAGKTTTLRLLVNLLQPSTGAVRVLGVDSRRLSHRELRRIGYVSENQVLPGRLSVAQYFDYLRPLYPAWDRAFEAKLRDGLELPAGTRIGALSRGGRSRLALAAALPYRPVLLLLDEPFSGLDPLVRDQVLDEVLDVAQGTTIVISSHDLDEIEGLVTHVAFMDRGTLRTHEPAEALSARFRAVTLTLEDAVDPPTDLPPAWLEPRALGRTLSFVDSAFTGADALAAKAAVRLGAIRAVDTQPMALKDISKHLMAARKREMER